MIVVVTAHRQSYARIFQAGGSSALVLGNPQDRLAGPGQKTFFVQPKR